MVETSESLLSAIEGVTQLEDGHIITGGGSVLDKELDGTARGRQNKSIDHFRIVFDGERLLEIAMPYSGPIAIIIEADEPALFFNSIAAAEKYLEPIDVLQGTYKRAFDPTGAPAEIECDRSTVVITVKSELPRQPDQLQEILKKFLKAVGVELSGQESPRTLLEKCERFVEK